MLETNKKNKKKDPVVFRTLGEAQKPEESRINTINTENIAEEDSEDGMDVEFGEPAELDAFEDENVKAIPKVKNRLAEKICYICKSRLGPDHSLRVGRFKSF
jgi:hypothetical protein